MTLIKSISGIRGTIGGKPGEGLSPLDLVKFTAAFGSWIKNRSNKQSPVMVVGRDARVSGSMVNQIVTANLNALGIQVLDLGLASTPTTEMAVVGENADGGIILTASHNPGNWNALKLLNSKGEFISDKEGKEILQLAQMEDFNYAEVDNLGKTKLLDYWDQKHIDLVLKLPLVDIDSIKKANFSVIFDSVNSVGGILLPKLLMALGIKNFKGLNSEANGIFAHNPEPLPQNLTQISAEMVLQKADVGFVVDPDVDRLAVVCEDGTMFGEEYTLVAVADYVLQSTPGNTVSNLSSTRALRDVTVSHGQSYFASAVGEVNVVERMKSENAVIGGEGNGGIIYPELHYGRDAVVGIALFLSMLAKEKLSCSGLRKKYPSYFMSKNKIELKPGMDVDGLLIRIAEKYKHEQINTTDGVKIDFAEQWVHLRKSNTEPIIRIYTESVSQKMADELAVKFANEILALI